MYLFPLKSPMVVLIRHFMQKKIYRFIIIFNFVQNGRIENFVRSLGPRGSNQIRVGTDRRHALRTINGMSHEKT